MKRFGDESGQALIISILCMTCLLGFAALATDVGVMLREKRLAQTAADAAAIAGALEINYSNSSIAAAAIAAAGQNGFTVASSGVTTANGTTVTVNHGPSFGPNAGNANYVEVIATQKQPAIFMGLFGFGSMTVSARAVAQNGGSSSYGCVYIVSPSGDPSGGWGLDLQGSFDLNTPNCGIIVDTTTSNALNFTGKAGYLYAGSIGVVGDGGGGGVSGSPKNSISPTTGIVPESDPLGSQTTPPDPSKLTCSAPPSGTLTGTIPAPAGGIACYSGTVSLTNANLGAGTYVFTGNVNVSGTVTTAQPPPPPPGSTVSSNPGNGVTLDINSGAFSVATGTTLNLYAPETSIYTGVPGGIAIMQPSTNTNTITIQMGNSTGTIDGIIYAPGAQLFLNDSGGDNKGGITLITDLIVGTMEDKTANLTIQSYSQSNSGTTPLTKVVLVE